MLTRHLVAVLSATALTLTTTGAVTAQGAQARSSRTSSAAEKADDLALCNITDYRCHNKLKRRGVSPKPTPGGGSSGGNANPCVNSASGTQVPCPSQWGSWSNDRQCYLRPDPSSGKTVPSGRTGRWYLCHRLDKDPAAGGAELDVWVDEPPSVDPGQLALDILAELQLQKVRIGITPEEGKTGLLGLPTYLWVDNPGPRTLGPISDSDRQGNVTVTLTAKVDHVTWNLGDGTTLTCIGAGTPYQDSFGAAPSPTCGHMYRKPSTGLPGGSYDISATAVWQVDWTGGGAAGSIPFEITSTGRVRISEVQALN